MNESIKRIEQSAKSYSPKNKPEILQLVEKANKKNAPQSDSAFHMAGFTYLKLPPLRFIGVDAMTRCEDWNALWQRKQEFLPTLEQMQKAVSPDLPYLCGFQHSTNGNVNVEDHLIVGYFFREGTPVPDGYDYMDFASQTVGYSVFENATLEHLLQMQTYIITRDKILADGKFIPYPQGYWNTDVFYDAIPPIDENEPSFRCGYLFPTIESNKNEEEK